MEGQEGGAYGGRKAGKPFDPIEYIKKPQVILRLISWVFSIIVFGCISAEGYQAIDHTSSEKQCMYNNNHGACGYGMFVGIMAFLACGIFLVIDAVFDNLSNVMNRKYAVIADLCFSAIHQMCTSPFKSLSKKPWFYQLNTEQGALRIKTNITGCLAVLAFLRYRQGAESAFAPSHDTGIPPSSTPYSSYPGPPEAPTQDSYQDAPFNQTKDDDISPSTYQAPSY
ncbi:synaptogyrin-2-like [Anneissia japonica]|uniref:synaptogyrin-2-like n=1 Tax=Anneissia japonica TaxID=1529436 RepID=UPI0014254CCA|nr:synaptogyrin-2-like [Anneissia japonica]